MLKEELSKRKKLVHEKGVEVMARYLAVRKGIECQIKAQGKVITMKHCRRIKSHKPVSRDTIFDFLGVREE